MPKNFKGMAKKSSLHASALSARLEVDQRTSAAKAIAEKVEREQAEVERRQRNQRKMDSVALWSQR